MKRLTCFFLLAVSLMACATSEAGRDATTTEIAASDLAIQTALASTPAPTPTSTITPFPLPSGWQDYDGIGFRVALPEQWQVVDVERVGIDAAIRALQDIDGEWAQLAVARLSNEEMLETLKLWAIDPEPAGASHAMLNVNLQLLPAGKALFPLALELEAAYKQSGIKVILIEPGFYINGLEAAHIAIRLPMETFTSRQYQYFCAQDQELWFIVMDVDETERSKYESIFRSIAQSFRLYPVQRSSSG